MADDVDLASERMEFEFTKKLNNLPKFDKPSLTECESCGEDIPLKRQQLGGVTRCFDCQKHFERSR